MCKNGVDGEKARGRKGLLCVRVVRRVLGGEEKLRKKNKPRMWEGTALFFPLLGIKLCHPLPCGVGTSRWKPVPTRGGADLVPDEGPKLGRPVTNVGAHKRALSLHHASTGRIIGRLVSTASAAAFICRCKCLFVTDHVVLAEVFIYSVGNQAVAYLLPAAFAGIFH